jgi:hypothetical protein
MAREGADHPKEPATRIGGDPAITSNARVLDFFRYWEGLKGTRRWPSRDDIDPTAIPHLLAGTVLLKVHRDPLDFEYRIIGDDIVARFGSLKGKRVREAALVNITTSAYKNYCIVVETGLPQVLEGIATPAYRDGMPIRVSRVHCPLSTDGQAVDWIFSYLSFLGPTGGTAPG